jgi:3'-5' exoribonuclease
MKSPYISELQANQTIHGVFLVTQKEIRQKKSGEPYLSVILADRTGELDAKMFDNASEFLDVFESDNFVRVKGLLQVFHNRPQLSLHKIQPVPDSEVDTSDFFPVSKRDRDEMFREVQQWIAGVTNPYIKQLLEAIFADESIAVPYRSAPAAKTVHHNFIGGLIEHVLSMCHTARFTAAHYPDIDFDLLLAGVLLHDIGKVRELSFSRSITYTNEGQLIGHIVMGIGMIDEKIRHIPDFPAPLRDLLLHMILSHHGELEYGSPKVPLFPEALLLHQIDSLDSKMECMRAWIEKDRLVEGEWTAYNSALDRSVLKKSRFLGAEPPTPAKAQVPAPASKPQPSSPFGAKLMDALRGD